MKEWYRTDPQLFVKKPYYLAGCDGYSMVSVGAGAAILVSFILFLGVGAFRRSAQHAATWSD